MKKENILKYTIGLPFIILLTFILIIDFLLFESYFYIGYIVTFSDSMIADCGYLTMIKNLWKPINSGNKGVK